MAKLQIHQFMCLSDNFGVLIHDADANLTASIDAPEAGAIEQALKQTGWRLTHILNTHHHGDHTGGNLALKDKTGCAIVGPRGGRIPGIDIEIGEGDNFDFAGHVAQILETPGHTMDHICYWFREDKVAFTGDTLFALGCGRVLEGSKEQMWNSLKKLKAMPDDTVIYCGHEYTEANARFSLTIEPDNTDLINRSREVGALRKAGQPTLPTTMGAELATNPFLRADVPELQEQMGLSGTDAAAIFAEIRTRKDKA